MSNNLPFDLEERVEDAFVQYLALAVAQSTTMKVFPALTTSVLQYPCATVMMQKSGKIVPDGATSVSRKMTGEIAVITEAKNKLDLLGRVVTTARDLNRSARNAVMTALSIADDDAGPADFDSVCQCDASDKPKGLAAYLTYQKIDGVWIKWAQMGDVERYVEGDKKCLVSVISVAVLAQPVQIGGY